MIYRERYASVAEQKSSITRHVRCVTTEILSVTVDHAVLHFQDLGSGSFSGFSTLHLVARILSTSCDNYIE
ncbi:hypothetical protein TNCV_3194741 [Trichonephila clavipes]|uniref:Uncharacterized protein n=1 Tax=Trichonephila clavipes TaxID=2585209 RepID=A0A8X6R920_TRICX|nr:hypothetical protein TNCV_3194741 [Trichonephila clavipes]